MTRRRPGPSRPVGGSPEPRGVIRRELTGRPTDPVGSRGPQGQEDRRALVPGGLEQRGERSGCRDTAAGSRSLGREERVDAQVNPLLIGHRLAPEAGAEPPGGLGRDRRSEEDTGVARLGRKGTNRARPGTAAPASLRNSAYEQRFLRFEVAARHQPRSAVQQGYSRRAPRPSGGTPAPSGHGR